MSCHLANVYLAASYFISFPSQVWTMTEDMFDGLFVVSKGSACRVVRLFYVVEIVPEFFGMVCPKADEQCANFS